jgi:hypothetical protein
MEKRITMVRDGDHINFVNQNGVAIASLYDHHDHIIFDKLTDSRELFGVDAPVDWSAWFQENGITVQSARLMDLMPNPSGTERDKGNK